MNLQVLAQAAITLIQDETQIQCVSRMILILDKLVMNHILEKYMEWSTKPMILVVTYEIKMCHAQSVV